MSRSTTNKAGAVENAAAIPNQSIAGASPAASLYTAEELAAAAQELFHTRPECVQAALRIAGKAKATRQEAADIVQKYMSKEVK